MLSMLCLCLFFFFFKQKTAYEMRISDWSSDVCSSGLAAANAALDGLAHQRRAEGLPATAVDWARFDIRGMLDDAAAAAFDRLGKIGRASCRERVCQYV